LVETISVKLKEGVLSPRSFSDNIMNARALRLADGITLIEGGHFAAPS
jgi:hypothetical protein